MLQNVARDNMAAGSTQHQDWQKVMRSSGDLWLGSASAAEWHQRQPGLGLQKGGLTPWSCCHHYAAASASAAATQSRWKGGRQSCCCLTAAEVAVAFALHLSSTAPPHWFQALLLAFAIACVYFARQCSGLAEAMLGESPCCALLCVVLQTMQQAPQKLLEGPSAGHTLA